MNVKYIYVILACLISTFKVYGQTCLSNEILFTTQESVDSFRINYPGCSFIEGSLNFFGNDINNIDSLGSIQKITGNLVFSALSIPNFQGINNLDSIFGTFEIYELHQISDLSGLENLEFTSKLVINDNNNLKTLNGLNSNIYIDCTLELAENPMLQVCNNFGVCEHLMSNGIDPNIVNNADGCNTEDEIINSCIVKNLDRYYFEDDNIKLYPNPVSNRMPVYIESDILIDKVRIFNSNGDLIWDLNIINNLFIIPEFQVGFYFVELVNENGHYLRKLVIN